MSACQQVVGGHGARSGARAHQTHARPHPQRRSVQQERVAQRHPEPIGDHLRVLLLPVDQDRELVAADPGQRVGVGDAPAQPLPHGAQQVVPGGVTEPVVDVLEVVEVDEDQHERAVAHGPFEPLPEQPPVGQTRQGVVQHLMGQSALRVDEPACQQPLLTHGNDLPGGHQHDHRDRDSDHHRPQHIAGQHMERQQQRDAEEPRVRQHQLRPVDQSRPRRLRRGRFPVPCRQCDEQRPERETEIAPDHRAVEADRVEVRDHPVGRGDQHDAAAQLQIVHPEGVLGPVHHSGHRRDDDQHEFCEAVGHLHHRVPRPGKRRGRHGADPEDHQDRERRRRHHAVQQGEDRRVPHRAVLRHVHPTPGAGKHRYRGKREDREQPVQRHPHRRPVRAREPPDELSAQHGSHGTDSEQTPPSRDTVDPARLEQPVCDGTDPGTALCDDTDAVGDRFAPERERVDRQQQRCRDDQRDAQPEACAAIPLHSPTNVSGRRVARNDGN